jgi:pyruvate-formate lyase-activating enzyme
MQPLRILLVNPPIVDFTAYDFWLRPYGMLRVAARMQHACDLHFFDFLVSKQRDKWGRGRFDAQDIPKPKTFSDIPRKFRRFGRPRAEFRDFLRAHSFDAVLIQTGMTYWYPGVQEVIEDTRALQPSAKIILGGVYATLCPSHAQSLGPDLVIEGAKLEPMWELLSVEPKESVPYWPSENAGVGVMKLSEGCPFRCTYCSAPLFWPEFVQRPTEDCLAELKQLNRVGANNIAFYDDALLFRANQVLVPFLESVIHSNIAVCFHTPNALNARFITPDVARMMVRAGFATFFLGFESSSASWQDATGGKVHVHEFEAAVRYLKEAGAHSIVTYIIVGHPDSERQDPERSIRFAHQCGTRVLLSEFSPVPGTADGLKSGQWADLQEPLSHNKTAFAIRRLGADSLNRLKQLTHALNLGADTR